jgi:hypothetical protein
MERQYAILTILNSAVGIILESRAMAEVSQAQGKASADATAAMGNPFLYEKPNKLPLPEVLALARDHKSVIDIKLSLLFVLGHSNS